MIEKTGNILASGADVLVIPVNTKGVAGAGLALAAKKRFPRWFRDYAGHCQCRNLRAGDALLHPAEVVDMPRIVSIATKDHWRDPSRLGWVARGLDTFAALMEQLRPESVAVPAVGCSLGGLRWQDVRPLIVVAAERMERVGVQVFVYPPGEK